MVLDIFFVLECLALYNNNVKIQKKKSLTKLNTFGIKSAAEYFCEPRNDKEIIEAVDWAEKNGINWVVLGGGSNIVCSPIVRGLVIKMPKRNIVFKNGFFVADAGVMLDNFVVATIVKGYKGLELLSWIPGTVGGATIGNAGAYGVSMQNLISRVCVLMRGKIKWITNKACKFGYRESALKHLKCVVLRIECVLEKGNKKELWEKRKNIIAVRSKKFKKTICCPGSYFKNIHIKNVLTSSLERLDKTKIFDGKIPAGYVLELINAKEVSCGGMCVADFHANCIINTGGGTSDDAKNISENLKQRIYKEYGIVLEEEVRYL